MILGRKERPSFVTELEKALPCCPKRLLILPGTTGLTQIQFKPDTDLKSVANKFLCDLRYVQNLSASLNLQILLGTSFHLNSLS